MARIFDIETDGFLEACTVIHCLVIRDTDTGLMTSYTGPTVVDGIKALQAGEISGHNVIKFDLPVIKKLYPWFTYDESNVVDTLVCTRLIFANIANDHQLIARGKMPKKLMMSQSLEAWGYRLGKMKGEYVSAFKERLGALYEPGMEWRELNPEMLAYCVQDVEVTTALYELIKRRNYSQDALDIEHGVAVICAKMERTGFPFNVKAAATLYGELAQKRDEILVTMQNTFADEVIERWSEKTGKRLKDKVIVFNPGSRKQIADRLTKKYGWIPTEFTEGGGAKIDETVLEGLNYPEAKILANYFTLEKRVGQIAEGDNAWLKLERKGKLHGGYNPNGAITGRCTHQTPNMGQVPAVRSLYGKECRSLFGVPIGFSLVGTDLSGIEARLLAHFMAAYDDGAYATAVISGNSKDGTDIHSVNQRAAGLATRDQAKTFFYAFLYGAGDEKIGSIVGGGAAEGKKLKAAFLKATPALKKLREAVASEATNSCKTADQIYADAQKTGWSSPKFSGTEYLKGLDGRHTHARSPHAALNTLLQGAGAVISKQWLIEVVKLATAKGWVWKEDWTGDYGFCAWVHDEIQIGVRNGLEEEFGQLVVEAALMAGRHFGIEVPIGAEFKIGKTWNDTH